MPLKAENFFWIWKDAMEEEVTDIWSLRWIQSSIGSLYKNDADEEFKMF